MFCMDSRGPNSDYPPTTSEQRHGWVRRHPIVTAFLLLVILLVAAVWILHDQAERALAGRIAAIRDRGEPVTVQDIVYSQPNIPDEENLTLKLAAAGRNAEAVGMSEDESKSIPYLGAAKFPLTGERWNDAMLKESEAYLARCNDALNELHAALKLERGSLNIYWTTPAINVLMPELSDLRQATKALVLECQIAAQQGNREKAEQCLLDMRPLMRAVDGSNTLIGALVQISVTALVQETIERNINLCGISDASLHKLQVALREAESFPDMKQAFFGERVMFLDTLQWVRSSGPGTVSALTGGQGTPGPEAMWSYIPVLPELDIAAGLDHYSLMVNAVGQPDAKSIHGINALDTGAQRLPKYCVMTRVMLPSLSRSIFLWVRTVGTNRALRAAIAAERFRLATAHWPEKLVDLVPRYLDAVPIDPIDGKPIRYAIIPEGIKTWTICDDDKNEDNGGDVKRLERRTGNSAKDRPKDYGWVILNPAMRNRPAQAMPQSTSSQAATRPSEKRQ